MLALSPIVHAAAVQTPLLLLLGASDARVPVAQGIDYYKLLKARGVNTRLLLYPDSQHSLNEKPSIEADVFMNSFQWLAGRFNDKTNPTVLV